jgi:hypothetical protein
MAANSPDPEKNYRLLAKQPFPKELDYCKEKVWSIVTQRSP